MEGQLVVLNEAFNIVDAATTFDPRGEVMTVYPTCSTTAASSCSATPTRSASSACRQPMRREKLQARRQPAREPAHRLRRRARCRSRRSTRSCSRRFPTSRTTTSAASATRSKCCADAIELPYLHADRFKSTTCTPPKGILLYGPPGCGKTLIAKAVANSLAAPHRRRPATAKPRVYFLNIKGPELLNKYVGETERQIRAGLPDAREKAEEDVPVIVFFDEMDSLFRMRGIGHLVRHRGDGRARSSSSEIDGVESLQQRDRDRRVEPRRT